MLKIEKMISKTEPSNYWGLNYLTVLYKLKSNWNNKETNMTIQQIFLIVSCMPGIVAGAADKLF